jgi:polyprenyl-phospho-N-acetylgalactosaminyl synthase
MTCAPPSPSWTVRKPAYDAGAACVVVPMYNEAAVIASVVAELRTTFDLVVCVDDGSSDGCADVARAAGATVLRHAVNLGQGAALQTGLTHAVDQTRAQLVVTFDADGQHRTADAARLVERARLGDVDVVLGSRFLGARPDGVPRARRWLLRAAVGFTRLTTGLGVTDTHNGLRVFTRPAAQRLQLRSRGMAHASELLHQVAAHRWRICELPVSIDYTEYSRGKGQPSVNAVNIVFDLLLQQLYPAR